MNLAQTISRPVVLPRSVWKAREDGRGLAAERGTWCPLKGTHQGGSVIVPLLSCPSCARVTFLIPDMFTAGLLRRMGLQFPIGHDDHPPLFDIDRMGKVSAKSLGPELSCCCGFRRRVHLDRWNHEKPLWVVAFVKPGSKTDLDFSFCHAASRKEALMHFGNTKGRVIDAGPAVGFFTDEKTGAQHV